MRSFTFALACLGCTGHARRVNMQRPAESDDSLQAVADASDESEVMQSRTELARMFLALDPAHAFSGVSSRPFSSVGATVGSLTQNAATTAAHPLSHRLRIRSQPKMMPIGRPKVPYKAKGPGVQQADWIDIMDRLYRERILFLGSEIDDEQVNQIIAIMLYLDSESSNKDEAISMYINSPGGSVPASLALYDTMQYVKSPIVTCNIGLAASMGSFILGGGAKGKRLAMPHSRVMMHQPSGSGFQGQAEDIKVVAQQVLKVRDQMVTEYAAMTGRTLDQIVKDIDRDNFMSAEEALEYGLIDRIVGKPKA